VLFRSPERAPRLVSRSRRISIRRWNGTSALAFGTVLRYIEIMGAEQARAGRTRGEANAILDTVTELVTDFLQGLAFALRAPVVATFRDTPDGNTGVDVAVRLDDPADVNAAAAALAERFPDPLSEVSVT